MKTRNIICMALLVSVTAMARDSFRWRVNAAKSDPQKVCTIELQNPEAFDQISLNVAGDLEYTQSTNGTSGVTLIVSENVIDKIEAFVAHGRLSIECKRGLKNVSISNAQIRVIAHSPSLSVVKLNASGDVTLKESIRTEELTLHINGSGDINAHDLTCRSANVSINGSGDINVRDLTCQSTNIDINGSGDINMRNLNCQSANVVISGSGDVNLAGKAKEAYLEISGSGDIDCKRLLCQQVRADINGSGDIDCYASETLTAHIDGSGEIDCSGSPQKSIYKKR